MALKKEKIRDDVKAYQWEAGFMNTYSMQWNYNAVVKNKELVLFVKI